MRKVLDLQTTVEKIAGRVDAGQFKTAEQLITQIGPTDEPIVRVLSAQQSGANPSSPLRHGEGRAVILAI